MTLLTLVLPPIRTKQEHFTVGQDGEVSLPGVGFGWRK